MHGESQGHIYYPVLFVRCVSWMCAPADLTDGHSSLATAAHHPHRHSSTSLPAHQQFLGLVWFGLVLGLEAGSQYGVLAGLELTKIYLLLLLSVGLKTCIMGDGGKRRMSFSL